jgi:cytochrome b561
MAGPSRTGYSGAQIALHWIIAVLVVIQLLLGEEISATYDKAREGWHVSPMSFFLVSVHYYNGLTILGLVLLRLALRLVKGAPAPALAGWMHMAAAASHAAFYVLLIAMPVLGWVTYWSLYFPDWYPDEPFGDLHELGATLLIALICIHVAAALFHQFWLKDGTLHRMLLPRR